MGNVERVTAYLGLGSNLGCREKNLDRCVRHLTGQDDTAASAEPFKPGNVRPVRSSDTYETEPWGFTGQGHFLNRVLEVSTAVPPQELLLLEQGSGGVWLAELDPAGDTLEVLKQFGTVPLPPYIQRQVATEEDRQRYQTVFARHPGAVAAPTAGLHLSTDLLDACDRSGLGLQHITLHVGLGTFRPIAAEQLDEHLMHSEWCQVTQATSKALENVRRSGHRVVAVGTTVVRTLETAAANGSIEPFQGHTDLFIRPGHTFRSFDALLTNFHLPRSTLFVLVCTVCGIDLAKSAYAEAIARRYCFYSYGDAMLIL